MRWTDAGLLARRRARLRPGRPRLAPARGAARSGPAQAPAQASGDGQGQQARGRRRAKRSADASVSDHAGNHRGLASAQENEPAEEFEHAQLLQIVPGGEQHQSEQQSKTDPIAGRLNLGRKWPPGHRLIGVEQQVAAIEHRDGQQVHEADADRKYGGEAGAASAPAFSGHGAGIGIRRRRPAWRRAPDALAMPSGPLSWSADSLAGEDAAQM